MAENKRNCVLICDDEIHIVKALEYKFAAAGFEVLTAQDGEEAWEIILDQQPSVVITDYQMPRLNGFDLVRRMRTEREIADIPVLMLTAKGFELARHAVCEDLGVLALIPKPFSPRELLIMVQGVLEGDEPFVDQMLRTAH